jgi:hypothetical protein
MMAEPGVERRLDENALAVGARSMCYWAVSRSEMKYHHDWTQWRSGKKSVDEFRK